MINHSAESSSRLAPIELDLRSRLIDPPEEKWQVAWAWLSERANPIVAKEARQSFNSKQFVLSFGLTLLAIGFWTVFSVGMQLPEIYYVPGGQLVLTGYLMILAFPLLLVIPFSAFRSMVVEAEERTFELISISGLSASQIIHGKLFSACLQMVLYLAVLTPCVAITYLLRGVTLDSVAGYLIMAVLMSITLTAIGLLVATISRSRALQVIANICVLTLLLFVFVYWCVFVPTSLQLLFVIGLDQAVLAMAWSTLVAAFVPVCMRAACAAIDFPSENHAFAVRVRLMALVAIAVFWGLELTLLSEDYDACCVCLNALLAFFLVVGALVAGEQGILSVRAQRSLPKTVFGRIFLTWFYPGSGMGYVFLNCLLLSAVVPWIVISVVGTSLQLSIGREGQIAALALVVCLYFAIFTGLTRLVMLVVSRRAVGRIAIAFVLQVMLVGAGALIPNSVMLLIEQSSSYDYGPHQALNIFWTLEELTNSGITGSMTLTLLLLPLLAALIFGLNLVLCSRDVMVVRVGLPTRLLEEQNAQAPAPAAPPNPLE